MTPRTRTETLIALAPPERADLLRAVTEACLRQNVAPTVMPLPPALPEESGQALDRAGLLLALLDTGAEASHVAAIGEACRRALETETPCLIFARRGAVLADFDPGPHADVAHYDSVADLRAQIVNRLAAFRETDIATLHYVGEIPAPPAEYIAHPYTLLPAAQMAGRGRELDLLTEWITASDHRVRVLSVVAIGGMGKSAMTWKWYQDTAPTAMKPLSGRMWWSFYESDAHFENFVIRALAYVTNTPEAEIREITPPERERELLDILDREPFLVVLDGIERILVAYARLDAARMDDAALDAETANQVAGAIGMPQEAQASMFSPHRLRKTADPRAGAFLRKLARVGASRILVSTRLYPADLQGASGHPIPGSFAVFLSGLEDDDALALWRAFGNSGTREELLAIFHTFENYPLLIRALAGAVARFAPAPGDFAAWRRANPGFDPIRQPSEGVKAHVMSYALTGLSEAQRRTLDLIAAFRMPSTFDALAQLLVRDGAEQPAPRGGVGGLFNRLGGGKPKLTHFEDEAGLDAALAELEARGLLGWDRRANRYDLHPIVRGVAWNALDDRARQGLYARLNAHFGSLPPVSLEDVRSLDDLTGVIEMYNTLIGLRRYDEAFAVYTERLNLPMLRRLSASLQRIELLEGLFPDGIERPPRLARPAAQARALNALALGYHTGGGPGRAAGLYLRAAMIAEQESNLRNVSIGLGNLSDTLRQSGNLRAAEAAAHRALLIDRAQEDRAAEALSLQFAGLVRMARGATDEAQIALERALRIHTAQQNIQLQGVCYALLAEAALLRGDVTLARTHADRAWTLADHAGYELDYVRAARVQGAAALADGDLVTAAERLNVALTRARAANATEHELPALIGLAEMHRLEGNTKGVRNLLDDVWEPAERGPYRLLHADAYNVLTQLERDLGQMEPAQQTATAAYYLAWCDGPPYAYAAGLSRAREHLAARGAPEPDDLPPFDAAAYGPFLEAEIDPADAFSAEVDMPADPSA
jgi:tetratricopeptide (TPR) repeat protein